MKITKILNFSNKGTYGVVEVLLEDGEVARIFVGGEVEVFFHAGQCKAFVKKGQPNQKAD